MFHFLSLKPEFSKQASCSYLSTVKKIFFILIVLLNGLTLAAQNNGDLDGFRHISVRNGLPSSEVYYVIQDSKGYVWMCTDAGVCRYTGFSFVSFTTREGLTDNTVFRLKEDNRGRIWAQGFSGGLSYFEGGHFNPVKANDSLVKIFQNGQRLTHFLETDSVGGIIVGGLYSNGVYRIGPEDNFSSVKKMKSPLGDFCYRAIWSTSDRKVFTFSTFQAVPTLEYSATVFHNGNRIKFPLMKGAGNFNNNRSVLTRDNRILYSYDTKVFEILPDGNVKEHAFPKYIVGLNIDLSGNVWVSMRDAGTFLFYDGNLDQNGKQFLNGHTVSCVCEDSEKGYWFSTVGEGVYYLPDLNINYLAGTPGYAGSPVRTIEPLSGGRIVFGSENNMLYLFNADHPDTVISAEITGNPNAAIDAVYTYHDTILVSGNAFYYLLPDFSQVNKTSEVGHAKGRAFSYPGKAPFFFTHTAFYFFDQQNNFVRRENTNIRYTAAGYDKDGNLWLGSLNGLWKYENGIPVFMNDSLSGIHSRVDVIVSDSTGLLWIATRGEGIYVKDGNRYWHLSEKDGMASNICRSLAIDQNGNVWAGTNRGVTLISGFDRKTGKANLRSFNNTHGLLSDEILCLLCQNGKLFMGSYRGICWIDINSLTRQTVQPPVYLNRILYGEDTISMSVKPSFEFSDATIRVFIEGLSYHDPEGLRYRYRLSGGSGEWITTANREISFSGLSPGDYRLEIFAVNSSGIGSKKPVVFSFTILTPFYRSWWFILILVLLLIGIVWVIAGSRAHRLRVLAKEKAANERRIAELRLSALRAQMNPHFIFNAINSIQHFVLKNESDQAYNYLSKFSRLIRLVLDQSQTDLIPISEEIKMLELYVELEQLRFERPFRFDLFVDPDLSDDNVMIPGMLVQPFIENAIWHGLLPKKEGDAFVSVRFSKHGDHQMEIRIEDNGIGRKAAAESVSAKDARRSYGMLITEERLKLTQSRNTFTKTVISITDLEDAEHKAAGTLISIIIQFD